MTQDMEQFAFAVAVVEKAMRDPASLEMSELMQLGRAQALLADEYVRVRDRITPAYPRRQEGREMSSEDWLDSDSEWAGTEGWEGPGFYVIDANGIVAGRFDDAGEGGWWLDKSVRVA